MAEPGIGEQLAFTLQNFAPGVSDNVTNQNALLRELKKKGNIKTVRGGRTLVEHLTYAEADYQRYSGWDTLSVQQATVLDAAEFTPVQSAVPVAISGRDERINRGREQIRDIVKVKAQNASDTMANRITQDIYSDGTGTNQINGLQALIADDPTTGTVGGINASTFAFWQNKMVDVSDEIGTVNAANVLSGMNKLWLECTRGTDAPDLITSDDTYFTLYEENLQPLMRFSSEQEADAGFMNYRYKRARVLYDGDATTTGHPVGMYFINTKYLCFKSYEGANFQPTQKIRATNQDGTVMHILWMGNLTCSNRSLQGRLKS